MDFGGILKATICLGLIFLYAFVAGGKVPYFLFYNSLGILSVGFIWVTITSRVSAHCYTESLSTQVGSTVKLVLEVQNRSGWPVPWVQCWIVMPETLCMPENLACYTISLKPHEKKVLYEEVECRQRGRFRWGNMLVRTGDILGVFTRSRQTGQQGQIVVLPEICDLGDDPEKIYRQGWGLNPVATGKGRSGSEFVGVRKYDAGDGISRIHWKASARSQTLLVKEFQDQKNSDFLIVIDTAAGSHTGTGSESSLEKAVTIAASLASMGLRSNYGTGLVICGSELIQVPNGYGKSHFNMILETLVAVRAEPGPSLWENFGEALLHGKKSRIFLITGIISQNLQERLLVLRSRGQEIVVFVLKLETFGDQNVGLQRDIGQRDISSDGRTQKVLALQAGGISVILVDRDTDLRLLFRGLEYGNG